MLLDQGVCPWYTGCVTGAEIRSIREALGITQRQMSTILGVHVVSLSRWESSDSRVPTVVAKLAMAIAPAAGAQRGRKSKRK